MRPAAPQSGLVALMSHWVDSYVNTFKTEMPRAQFAKLRIVIKLLIREGQGDSLRLKITGFFLKTANKEFANPSRFYALESKDHAKK